VVDDDEAYVEAYANWLEDEYNVIVANGGGEALTQIDNTIDVVLLDRRMPELNGDQVLKELRKRQLDCRVALVTAVEPELTIVDMDFDEYITKPVSQQDLKELIEQLLIRDRFSEAVQRGFQLASKKSTLEAAYSSDYLESSDKYMKVVEELMEVEEDIGKSINNLIESDQIIAAYQDLQKQHPK
jgi:DNA-binding response OmpR family regulator